MLNGHKWWHKVARTGSYNDLSNLPKSLKVLNKTYTTSGITAGSVFSISIDKESKNIIGASYNVDGVYFTNCFGNFNADYSTLILYNASSNNTGTLTVTINLLYME